MAAAVARVAGRSSQLLARSAAPVAVSAYSTTLRTITPLSDQDRIFTNLYGKHDFKLAGAKKRVRVAGWGGSLFVAQSLAARATGTRPRRLFSRAARGSSTR